MKVLFFLIIISVVAVACTSAEKPAPSAAKANIDSLFTEYYTFKKRINPLEATKAGFAEYNGQLANYISTAYQEDLRQQYRLFLRKLAGYDSTMVSPSQWLSKEVMEWDCTIKLQGLENPLITIPSPIFDIHSFELFPLDQINSLHLYVAQLAGGTSIQPFKTVKDYDNWLLRCEAYMGFLDTAISKMKTGIAKGIVAPKVIVERMIPQVASFANTAVGTNLFYSPVKLIPVGFADTDKQRLTEDFTELIGKRIIPKYRELLEFLTRTYLPAARQSVGLSSLPGGAETFDYLIRYYTTTNMTAPEIHELGKREVARIRGEMEKVKTQIGFNGDLKSFFAFVRNNKKLQPYSTPEQVLAGFDRIRDTVKAKLGDVFGPRPKGPFEVRRTEAFREASASAEFLPGNKDGSRPGIFYVPVPDATSHNILQDEALFLHEAIPGHYYQLTLQQENEELPEFLHPESISVFVEGWGLYAESLGQELGLYKDPYSFFGMLTMEMHRAIRLVLETGIHTMGWTRQQAIDYSLVNEADTEEAIAVEVERYIATPGQALCYKVGQIKIRELRTRAEKELGAAFSIKEFHNQVLNSGSLPLVLLEKKIDAWIRASKTK